MRMTEEEFRRMGRPAANSCHRDGVTHIERTAISSELQAAIDKANSQIPPPLEDEEQAALVAWLKQQGVRHHATPNGGYRNKATAGKLKSQGVTSGVPDLTVWPPGGSGLPVVWVELKRQRGGQISAAQQAWIDYINTVPGHRAAVCCGCMAAIRFLQDIGY